ncbi:MAG TPA: YkvA family protein [Candidatus Margulisiibacteriota bacterium]|nr:YkvA family protein [Candidatus Margulisiibacteriota bacterium]
MLLRVAGATFEKATQQRASLSRLWDDLMTLARLVAAWSRKEYTAVPWRSILMAAGALVYFLDPFDAIPDAIPGFGYLDDASVVALVASALKTDIDRFVRWEQARAECLRSARARRIASKFPSAAPTTR